MRLKEYFEKTGVQKNWFARKVGMNANQFYQITCGIAFIPQKYWEKIIEVSENKITLQDLMEEFKERRKERSDSKVYDNEE